MSKHEIIPVIGDPEGWETCDTDTELESVMWQTEIAQWDAVSMGAKNAGSLNPRPRLVITDKESNRYVIEKIVTKSGRCELHIQQCCLKPSTKSTNEC